MLEVGDILYPAPLNRPGFIVKGTHDARSAGAVALAAYLRQAVFIRYGNDLVPDVLFKLCHVFYEWPDPQQELQYPSASIIDNGAVMMLGHNFTPTPLEDTWNVHAPRSMLWKLADISYLMQVDFWLQTPADREAVAAALPGLFAPGEGQSNVYLQGSDKYFGLPVRVALESYQRMDTPQAIWEQEHRLMAQVRVDVDVVELRCAVELQPEVHLITKDGGSVSQSPESGDCTTGG